MVVAGDDDDDDGSYDEDEKMLCFCVKCVDGGRGTFAEWWIASIGGLFEGVFGGGCLFIFLLTKQYMCFKPLHFVSYMM